MAQQQQITSFFKDNGDGGSGRKRGRDGSDIPDGYTDPKNMETYARFVRGLDPSQREAFKRVVIDDKDTVIVGVAGSGKSFLITRIVLALIYRQKYTDILDKVRLTLANIDKIRYSERKKRALELLERCNVEYKNELGEDIDVLASTEMGIHVITVTGSASLVLTGSTGLPTRTVCSFLGTRSYDINRKAIHDEVLAAGLPAAAAEKLYAVNVDKECRRVADKIWKEAHPATQQRLKKARVIIVDEMSMLSGEGLRVLDYVLQRAGYVFRRGQHPPPADPFNGVRIVLCGDFMQLPPVNARLMCADPHFKHFFPPSSVVELKVVHRQGAGSELHKILMAMRAGVVTEELKDAIKKMGATQFAHLPILLRATNAEVNRINATELAKLDKPLVTIAAGSKGSPDAVRAICAALLPSGCSVVVTGLDFTACVGARVYSTINRVLNVAPGSPKIANGSLGTVVDIYVSPVDEQKSYVSVVFDHLLDRVVKIMPRICLMPVDEARRMASQRKAAKAAAAAAAAGGPVYVAPTDEMETDDGDVYDAFVRAIPLRLGWGWTIHRAQGLTAEGGVDINVSNGALVGEGAFYVALSRAKTIGSVRVTGVWDMNPYQWARLVGVNPDAVAFYKSLPSRV